MTCILRCLIDPSHCDYADSLLFTIMQVDAGSGLCYSQRMPLAISSTSMGPCCGIILDLDTVTVTDTLLQSWTALSASLSLSLPSGGPASVVWGKNRPTFVTIGLFGTYMANGDS